MQIKQLWQTIQTVAQPFTRQRRSHTSNGFAVQTALRAGADSSDNGLRIDLTPTDDRILVNTDLPGTQHDQIGDHVIRLNY